MNKRALNFGLIYCLIVIVFKIIILYSPYSKFWFSYSYILSVFFILPFFILATKQVRDKEQGGIIAGKEVMRICLTVLAVGLVILSVYNYFEFSSDRFMEHAGMHYNSDEFRKLFEEQQQKSPVKTPIDFETAVKQNLTDFSPLRATTLKLIPLIFIGFSGAFITAVFVKRSPK